MTQFIGTHHNKLDAKGRVSIPASFRAVLREGGVVPRDQAVVPLVLRPSHKYPCIEGWTEQTFHALAQPLNELDVFGDDGDDLALTVFGDARELETDKEGRVVMPAELSVHANLGDMLAFVGVGKTFQIWEPGALTIRRQNAIAAVREGRRTLRGMSAP